MKFFIEREILLKPLQQLSAVISSGRPIFPILGNIFLQSKEDYLLLIGTDLEMEIVFQISLKDSPEPGAITISARKLIDICRSLPEKSKIEIALEKQGSIVVIRSGPSRFSLSTLPASQFPILDSWKSNVEFTLSQSVLKQLIESTHFSMGHQDVRYYLNGMLFETEGEILRTVATDGHRLAICSIVIGKRLPFHSVIVPRKGVMMLAHLMEKSENLVKIQISNNHIRAWIRNAVFTAKLIDGHFPNYRCALPKNPDKTMETHCNVLKQAFARMSIFANEKFKGVKLTLRTNELKIYANQSDQGEAEETLSVNYRGPKIEVGFNVNYILDVLNALKCEIVRLLLTDETSSVQFEDPTRPTTVYIIMPLRL